MGDALSTGSESPKAISHSFISASSRISSDLGSNVVSELLGLFEGDGLSEPGEVGSIWTGLDARRDHRVMLSPIRSSWPARRACQFVHRLLKFFAG